MPRGDVACYYFRFRYWLPLIDYAIIDADADFAISCRAIYLRCLRY